MMHTEPSRLNHREDMALVALLTEPTIADAAQRTGVGEATLYRWLQHPEFQAKYHAVRRLLLEHAITQLQAATSEAVVNSRVMWTERCRVVCTTQSRLGVD